LQSVSSLFVLLVALAFRVSKESVEVLESVMSLQTGDTPDLVGFQFSKHYPLLTKKYKLFYLFMLIIIMK
jgi:hypothetical protein